MENRASQIQELLSIAQAELMTAAKAAALGKRNLGEVLRLVEKKYPKMEKGIKRIKRVMEGLPGVTDHLASAEALTAVAKRLAELENRPEALLSDDFLAAVAPGANSTPAPVMVADAKVAIGDTEG